MLPPPSQPYRHPAGPHFEPPPLRPLAAAEQVGKLGQPVVIGDRSRHRAVCDGGLHIKVVAAM